MTNAIPRPQVEEIVVVTANLTRRHAGPCVLEGLERRRPARKEPRLYLLRDFHFVSGAALRLLPLLDGAALGVQEIDEPGTLNQMELVAVDIQKSCMNAPGHRHRGLRKADPASRPLREFGCDILSRQRHSGGSADPGALFGALARLDQREN